MGGFDQNFAVYIMTKKNRQETLCIKPINRVISIMTGSILGMGGFFYANHKKHGVYSIGINKISEVIVIIIFQIAAINSKEKVSIGLLQTIAIWHLTCLTYYYKQSNWF